MMDSNKPLSREEVMDVIGKTQSQIIEQLGLQFNDKYCSVWRYHIQLRSGRNRSIHRYLYLNFHQKIVIHVKLLRSIAKRPDKLFSINRRRALNT